MTKFMKLTVFLLVFTSVGLSAGVLYHASSIPEEENTSNGVKSPLVVSEQTKINTYYSGISYDTESVLRDAGVVVSGGVEPYTYSGRIDTQLVGTNLQNTITVSDSSNPVQSQKVVITYNSDTHMYFGEQTNIPIYDQNAEITASQLIEDAGISVSGGFAPYTYSGIVDTKQEGTFTAEVKVTDSVGLTEKKVGLVKYEVKNSLEESEQINIPTYYQGLVTSADQLVEDAGLTVSGGVEPYTYSGVVDTKVVGKNFETTIKVSDSSTPVQSDNIILKYNVQNIPLVIGQQKIVPTYEQNEIVTPEQLFEDSGITIGGGYGLYHYLGDVNTKVIGNELHTTITVYDSANPVAIQNVTVRYNVGGSPLNVQPQTSIETYTKNEIVTPDQLIEDAGIVVSGGVSPYSYSGTIDTSETGYGFSTEITIKDNENPPKVVTTNVIYNIEIEDLTATEQTNIMTYNHVEEVTPEQFVEDAGIEISGGIAPYTYVGDVDTSTVGNDIVTLVFIEDTSIPPKDLFIDITYNVV